MNYENIAEELLKLAAQLVRQKQCKKLLEFLQGESQLLNYLYVNQDKPIHPKDISNDLTISQARVALLLNRMEKSDWIRRRADEVDARRTVVHITDVGIQEHVKRKQEILDHILSALEKVGLEESSALLSYTASLVN